MSNKKEKFGFTLIELLIVISIIGLLSSIAFYALSIARMRARDAKRIADVKQIQKALALYYDKNNLYPISGNCGSTVPNSGWCNTIQSWSGSHWIRNGSSINLDEFLKVDPVDPKPLNFPSFVNVGNYFYYANSYGGPGKWYMIVFRLENNSHELQKYDGVTACDGRYFHYGNGSNGIITLGGSCGE